MIFSRLNPKDSTPTFYEWIALVLLFLALVALSSQNQFLFFRDYGITWEGAYRLSIGQLPYVDFGIPVGPVGLIVPAISFSLFDASWKTFEYTQLFLNAVLLIICLSLLRRVSGNIIEIIASLVVFNFLFLPFLISPWYNSIALLLFLLMLRFILGGKNIFVFIGGVLCVLTIFSKQDYGVLAFFCALASIIFFLPRATRSATQIFYTFGAFILGIAVPTVLFLFFINLEDFLHWFNYGAGYGRRRVPLEIFYNPRLLLSIFALYFYIRTKDIFFGLASLIIFVSAVISYTSGLVFTSYFDVFLYAGFVFRTFSKKYLSVTLWNIIFGIALLGIIFLAITIKTKAIVIFVLFLLATILSKSVHYFGATVLLLVSLALLPSLELLSNSLRTSYLHVPKDSYFFTDKPLSSNIVSAPSELHFFSGTYAPKASYDGIVQLKSYIRENYPNPGLLKVLNLSELTPLYAELGLTPLKGLPLWFHTSVSFPKGEQEKLMAKLEYGYFDLVIYQEAHEVNSPYYKDLLNLLKKSSLYSETDFSNFPSPSGAFKSCGIRECRETNIAIYVRSK